LKEILVNIGKEGMRNDVPVFKSGDKVRVNLKVREKEDEKDKIQIFEGRVIGRAGSGIGETFTVRKIAPGGIGVERTFFVNSPVIEKIKVLESRKARRAKLYFLRKAGKELKRT